MTDTSPSLPRGKPGAQTWDLLVDGVRHVLRLPPHTPRRPRYLFYRHGIAVRLLHWINALCMLVMLMSGLQIFNASPALDWGISSNPDHHLLSLYADGTDEHFWGMTQIGPWRFNTDGVLGASDTDGVKTVRGFPAWVTLPYQSPDLAMGRLWHLAFAWLLVINGLLYFIYLFWSGHYRELVPTRDDIRHLPREIASHARLQFPKGEAAKHYNGLQRLTYFVVVFVLGPLIVLTGLTMSPTLDSAFPFLLTLFGGRQSARTIHFIVAFSFVGFLFIHIAALIVSAPLNGLRSMITGWFAVEKEGKDV
ncbi:MAG: cytochrome b/b6 domain-containing protein [Rhizomicrobium sp.]